MSSNDGDLTAEDRGGMDDRTAGLHPRVTLLGFLTTQDLQILFGVCDETVHNAVKRGELPPPAKLLGRKVWTVAAIKQHHERRQEEARIQADREQAQRDAKVAALYGGQPHGRRR